MRPIPTKKQAAERENAYQRGRRQGRVEAVDELRTLLGITELEEQIAYVEARVDFLEEGE